MITSIKIETEVKNRLKAESAAHGVSIQDFASELIKKVLNDEGLKLQIINEIKLGLGQNKAQQS